MIYIDMSSFLKLIRIEPYSAEVAEYIGLEQSVQISSITRLEAEVQMRGHSLGGKAKPAQLANALREMARQLGEPPFQIAEVSGRLFDIALKQHRRSSIHCRSLDRLHLAAMEELGIRRLMTHDGRQAEAALEMGFEVMMPGVE